MLVTGNPSRRIRSRTAARRARTYALVLQHWRRDVARGARVGIGAETADLPKRYRFDQDWVLVHLVRWNENRLVRGFRAQLDATGPIDLLRGNHDG